MAASLAASLAACTVLAFAVDPIFFLGCLSGPRPRFWAEEGFVDGVGAVTGTIAGIDGVGGVTEAV